MQPLDIPPLGVSEQEAQVRFAALQRKLVPLWEYISRFNDSEQTIVVVPSQTIEFDCKGAEMQAYEERMLFMVLLLRQPRARLVYATSQTILPSCSETPNDGISSGCIDAILLTSRYG